MEGLIHGEAYFRNFTVVTSTLIPHVLGLFDRTAQVKTRYFTDTGGAIESVSGSCSQKDTFYENTKYREIKEDTGIIKLNISNLQKAVFSQTKSTPKPLKNRSSIYYL